MLTKLGQKLISYHIEDVIDEYILHLAKSNHGPR